MRIKGEKGRQLRKICTKECAKQKTEKLKKNIILQPYSNMTTKGYSILNKNVKNLLLDKNDKKMFSNVDVIMKIY